MWTMAEHFAPYDKTWRTKTFVCPDCGWNGTGATLQPEMHEELMDFSCPTCDKMLFIVSYATRETMRDAAAQGNPDAIGDLKHIRPDNE